MSEVKISRAEARLREHQMKGRSAAELIAIADEYLCEAHRKIAATKKSTTVWGSSIMRHCQGAVLDALTFAETNGF